MIFKLEAIVTRGKEKKQRRKGWRRPRNTFHHRGCGGYAEDAESWEREIPKRRCKEVKKQRERHFHGGAQKGVGGTNTFKRPQTQHRGVGHREREGRFENVIYKV